jgi:hypothetical protein
MAGKFDVVLAILCLFFRIMEARKTMLVFIFTMPFSYGFKPHFRQESVCLRSLINLGKWALWMLLTESARPCGGPDWFLEVQSLFAAILFRAEMIIA